MTACRARYTDDFYIVSVTILAQTCGHFDFFVLAPLAEWREIGWMQSVSSRQGKLAEAVNEVMSTGYWWEKGKR